MRNTISPTSQAAEECGAIYDASIAFFVIGFVLYLVTFTSWIVAFCRRRRVIAQSQSIPLTPPSTSMEIQSSGVYTDLQDSINNYESIRVEPGAKPLEIARYIPRDTMHETFDGSRMSPMQAPKPPNFPPQTMTPPDTSKLAVTEKGSLNASSGSNTGDCENDRSKPEMKNGDIDNDHPAFEHSENNESIDVDEHDYIILSGEQKEAIDDRDMELSYEAPQSPKHTK